jgi:hypothetical protein
MPSFMNLSCTEKEILIYNCFHSLKFVDSTNREEAHRFLCRAEGKRKKEGQVGEPARAG